MRSFWQYVNANRLFLPRKIMRVGGVLTIDAVDNVFAHYYKELIIIVMHSYYNNFSHYILNGFHSGRRPLQVQRGVC